MEFDEFTTGLHNRGFININNIDSRGECNKNNRHYILLTDGLVIYSSIPIYSQLKFHKNEYVESWNFCEFTFDKLDIAIKLVDDIKNIENCK
jgi:hypothetical protein